MSGIMEVTDGTVGTNNELPENNGQALIKVIGVGGGGGNSVQHMIEEKVAGVTFYACNTDLQALNANTAEHRIQIGVSTTRGLGSGSNPEVGRLAAEESRDVIKEQVGKCDIVFLTAGMGGGTGTGATPVIANIMRKELKALTVAIVTKPFSFEGKKQRLKAEAGIEKLRAEVDALVVIPNDKLINGENLSLIAAFNECNDVLMRAVKGLSSLVTKGGYMNLDFNDVKTILEASGSALIGMGSGRGENAVDDAVQAAIHSPLLDSIQNCHARGLLANVCVSTGFTISEYNRLGEILQSYVNDDTDVKYGVTIDSNIDDDVVNVTVLMSGIEPKDKAQQEAQAQTQPQVQAQSVEPQQNSIFGGFVQSQQEPQPQQPAKPAPANPFAATTDVDLPGFLIKKAD